MVLPYLKLNSIEPQHDVIPITVTVVTVVVVFFLRWLKREQGLAFEPRSKVGFGKRVGLVRPVCMVHSDFLDLFGDIGDCGLVV